MFSWIGDVFKEEPKIEKVDPFFGKMEWYVGKNKNWWFAPEILTPLGAKEISVMIETDQDGPDDYHYALMKLLYERYPGLKSKIENALYEQYKSWDLDDVGWAEYNSPEKMLIFNDLGSVTLCADPEYYFELEYHVRDDLSPNYTLSLYFVIDAHWNISYSGAAD